ncbi:phosphatase PAP2 family protein [Caenispirillum bisanense]|uniref:phosphatase PAP2 family protein n=1 Tax=Caenispirillum bisanense TaxID=414052 RepID=UPI0031D5FDA3
MTVDSVLALARRHPRWSSFAAVLLVALASILLLDRPLAEYIHAGQSPNRYGFWRTVSKVGQAEYWYGLALIGLLVAFVRSKLAWTLEGIAECRRQARAWWFMIVAMLLSGAAVHAVKFALGRVRPKELFDTPEPLYGFFPLSGEQSFPSGHSQAIWSAMIALTALFPRHRWWFVAIAVMVAYSRVATFQHFLADILVGSAIGVLITLAVRDRFARKASLRIGKEA